MPSLGRHFDRSVIAKLSDARERLHDLIQRARDERAREEASAFVWPHDINAGETEAEVRRG